MSLFDQQEAPARTLGFVPHCSLHMSVVPDTKEKSVSDMVPQREDNQNLCQDSTDSLLGSILWPWSSFFNLVTKLSPLPAINFKLIIIAIWGVQWVLFSNWTSLATTIGEHMLWTVSLSFLSSKLPSLEETSLRNIKWVIQWLFMHI